MKGGIAELLNFKQKNKNMDEFIKVPVSENWHIASVTPR